ncbi:DUF3823 domain-containing protein [Segetibacter sp.]|jgi:hypothetical protein|uniref:DUF3823 domain-containing protein n=1 Tax=Segetibacter sp. TaxID=2231182 RepID=UPI0026284DFB|nr:DUF3823 domain-containing protein [Segetibacter sp.]MCW3078584.1 hypothetical protein [Segetibacter sp.]
MKVKYHFIVLLVLGSIALSCKKDNYAPPSSALTGRLVYKGEPIQVEYDRVPFELYQYGFGKVGPINGTITPEGTFSHMLFDGEYKFVIRPGQGPFLWPQSGGKADSISIIMAGSKSMDIEVNPYYMIRTPQVAKSGTNVTATFKAEKIITDAVNGKSIERASLYVNKTQFVSGTDNIGKTDLAGTAITDPNSISLTTAIPTITPTQNYIFARIGLKITGVEDMIFSPVVKLNL